MRVRILSDLHLEFSMAPVEWLKRQPPADLLILAGDLCTPDTVESRLNALFETAAAKHRAVVCVLGNHEYYSSLGPDEVESMFRAASQKHDVALLENETVWFENVQIVGTTLWSAPTIGAHARMSDSQFVNQKWVLQKHQAAVDFLHSLPSTEEKRIVVTHHLPSFSLVHPRFRLSGEINTAFASDSVDLPKIQADVWAFGHTHTECDTFLGKTRFVCSPWGYPNERRDFRDVIVTV
jgi:predicted phosphodiesterase